ncbi:histone PARylation factor 1 [Achroia grisella]|uniref:histone PARylation factor 1 n=1 Tax=Achroia grisella TaxID=688607 RepID=UPI0027D307F2|nr:histone PARylation factor 1 [Achroia grisella]
MSDEWKDYDKDSRPACKYGSKCYQKNPTHHATYKHPPLQKRVKKEKNRIHPYKKPIKPDIKTNAESSDKESKKHKEASTSTSKTQSKEVPSCTYETTCSIQLPETINYYDKDTDHSVIKELFLADMPSDFFKFYECLNCMEKGIEKTLSSVNLEMIGPYDLLTGKLPKVDDKELYLIHWRFFYDPPEFHAVLKKKGNSQYHIGYFRDDPDEDPVFLGSNDSAKGCTISIMSDNIFGAVYMYLQNEKKTSPFIAMACEKLIEKIKKVAEENNYSLEYNIKKRWSQAVTKTLHGAGIVVPYNKKTQLGYRHLVESDANIKKYFTQLEAAESQNERDKILSDLQPVITYANIAVDECDFGTGLEIGIALFCSGLKILEQNALSNLTSTYTLLKRMEFIKIIQAHIKYRRTGSNMSMLASS